MIRIEPLPWFVWIGVGLFVALGSIMIGGHMQLFAWVGLLFTAVGIAKLIYYVVMHSREEPKQKTAKAKDHYKPRHPVCRRCMSQVTYHDRFCRVCGLRLQ